MSGSNYEYCPICSTKALYVGEGDAKGCVVLHQHCYDMIRKPTANDRAVERIKAECFAHINDPDCGGQLSALRCEWVLGIIREEAERGD